MTSLLLIASWLLCAPDPPATNPARSLDLPEPIRQALVNNAEQLGTITVTWQESHSSPMSVKELAATLKLDLDLAEHFRNSRSRFTVSWQKGKYLARFESLAPNAANNPDAAVSMINQMAFDGTTLVNASRAGEEDQPWTVLRYSLDHYSADEQDNSYVNSQYFQTIGLSLPTRITDLKARRQVRGQILTLLDEGAKLTAVERVTLAGRQLVRLSILADNPVRKQAEKADLDKVAKELEDTINSDEYKRSVIEGIKKQRELPEKVVCLFYVDEQLNCAIRRFEQQYEDGTLLARTDCDDFVKIAGRDLCLPRKCTSSDFTGYNVPGTYFKDAILTSVFEIAEIKPDALLDEAFVLDHKESGTVIYDRTDPAGDRKFVVDDEGKPQEVLKDGQQRRRGL